MSLSQFDFVIIYRPGKQQRLSDALSRRSYLAPKAGEAAFDQQCTTLLKLECFCLCATIVPTSIDVNFLDQVRVASIQDNVFLDIKRRPNHEEDKFKLEGDLLYFEERLYIPEGPIRLRVLQSRHDFPAVGHFGFNKTLELISRDFWWPQMWKDVKGFFLSCDIC